MTTQEKLIFCKEHGISRSYIAERARVVPATITRWIRGEKGISKKNEEDIELTLHKIAQEIWEGIGDFNDGNL
jgi:transcriptional regulator with XRE-family HTH domain